MEVNSNTAPLPLSRLMSLIVVDAHDRDPLPRLNRGVSEVVDVPDTPLIIIDVSRSIASSDWMSNKYFRVCIVSVIEMVKVFNDAVAVTGNMLEEEVEATLSVTAVLTAPDFAGMIMRSVLLSEIGAVSPLYTPSFIFTLDALSSFARA